MNNTKFVIFITALIIGILTTCSCEFKKQEISTNIFSTEAYSINNGYGYVITYNNKVLIKQDNIPALPNNIHFQSTLDACMVAELVIQRLKTQQDPRIDKEDLINLAINTSFITTEEKNEPHKIY